MKWTRAKSRNILVAFITVVVLFALAYVIFVPRAVDVDVAAVTLGPFQEVIRVDGVLRSKDRYTVTAPANGDMKRVTLKVGDPVKKGERITDVIWDRFEVVRAPTAGVISKIFRESAGPINRGEAIVDIVDPSKLEVMAELLTTDAVRLRPGEKAWIENWAGGSPLDATVVRISKAGFVKQSALGVEEERTEVIADLKNPRAEILQNVGSTFHVDVTFEVSQTEQALKIPVGALFRDGASWAVYLADNGRARKTKVELAALGAEEASIKSGLQAGELVLVYPGDLVKDGSRIHVRLSKP